MGSNTRIHQPLARSYESTVSSLQTITESTALWKAMKHREEIERKRADLGGGVAAHGFFRRLLQALAWRPFRS